MTSHVSYPALDSSGVPATLSPAILINLLRKQMGFQGVVCSDSLLMAGVRGQFANEEDMCLAVLNAGVDLLLDLAEPVSVVDHLCKCVESGQLKIERVEEALQRVWTLKQKVFRKSVGISTPPKPSRTDTQSLAKRVAVRAIESSRKASYVLPLDLDKKLVAILLKPFETAIEPVEQPIAAQLRERFKSVQYAQLGPNSDAFAYESALKLAKGAEQLLIAFIVRPAAWHAFGLRPPQKELIHQLLKIHPHATLASLGVPHALNDFPEAATSICTYSDIPASQQALVDHLLVPVG
jgi:beta-glucosidase-like glycosyl hydrolase